MNRCLAEGRERLRRLLAQSEGGERCAELRPLLSSFCDGEADADAAVTVREHLRACARCRATVRAYRAAPGAVAALAPLPAATYLLGRLRELLAGVKGGGTAGMAKGLAVCAGAAGGAFLTAVAGPHLVSDPVGSAAAPTASAFEARPALGGRPPFESRPAGRQRRRPTRRRRRSDGDVRARRFLVAADASDTAQLTPSAAPPPSEPEVETAPPPPPVPEAAPAPDGPPPASGGGAAGEFGP